MKIYLTTDPGLWPERFTDHEREVIVRKLATASQIDLIIVMPKDSERMLMSKQQSHVLMCQHFWAV